MHAAEGASPSTFAASRGVGVRCTTMDPHDILSTLAGVAGDEAAYAAMARAGTAVVRSELSLDVFVERFARLLGASPTDLAAPGSVEVGRLV